MGLLLGMFNSLLPFLLLLLVVVVLLVVLFLLCAVISRLLPAQRGTRGAGRHTHFRPRAFRRTQRHNTPSQHAQQVRRAAEGGCAASQTLLGWWHFSGKEGFEQNHVKAAALFRSAADQGDANGESALAR